MSIVLGLENCDDFEIPKEYIKSYDIEKKQVKRIVIDKSYLDICYKYHGFYGYYKDKEQSMNRFLNANDVTQIYIDENKYLPKYIERNNNWYEDNVLQSIVITDDGIIFEWDLDKRNKVRRDRYIGAITTLYIHSKYENCFKASGINKIIFWDKEGER